MTPEERQLLGGLFDRVRENAQAHRDAEAEAFINNAIKAQPYAPYLMAQAVIVQEETLKGAVQKIEELEAKVRELESRAPAAQQPASGGFLGGLFGGGAPRQAQAAPPPPQGMPGGFGRTSGVPSTGMNVPPPPGSAGFGQQQPVGTPMGTPMGAPMGAQPYGQQPMQQGGPWQQPQQGGAGGSFLKGALGAAAGVAGGMLLANAVSGMFRGGGTGHDAASTFGKGDSASSALDKPGSGWGEPKTQQAGADNWDNSKNASGDDWSNGSSGSSGSSTGNDSWDNSSNVSGDDWDDSSSSSGGGDSWSDE